MDTEDMAALTIRLHDTTDAQVWASAWIEIAQELQDAGKSLIDEGWMIGWFANAIERGRDAGYRQAMSEVVADRGG